MTKILLISSILLGFATSSLAQVSAEEVLPADLVPVQRTITLNVDDCLSVWDGYQCSVSDDVGRLIGTSASIEPQSFAYPVGSFEYIRVEFTPRGDGYLVQVVPGSISGPYTRYVRRAFSSLPGEFSVTGIKIQMRE